MIPMLDNAILHWQPRIPCTLLPSKARTHHFDGCAFFRCTSITTTCGDDEHGTIKVPPSLTLCVHIQQSSRSEVRVQALLASSDALRGITMGRVCLVTKIGMEGGSPVSHGQREPEFTSPAAISLAQHPSSRTLESRRSCSSILCRQRAWMAWSDKTGSVNYLAACDNSREAGAHTDQPNSGTLVTT